MVDLRTMHLTLAYLDSSSVSMLLTAIAGGVAGLSVFVKSYFRRIKQRLLRRPIEIVETSPVPEAPPSEHG
jgi:hypothetical protein